MHEESHLAIVSYLGDLSPEDSDEVVVVTTAMRSSQSARGVAVTTVIAAIFGLFWGFTGTAGLPSPFELLGRGLLLVITLILFAVALGFLRLARRLPSANGENGGNPFRTRAYKISVLLMAIAIPITSIGLRNIGFEDAIVPVIAIIVGLHFFGLIRAFDSQRFAIIGGAICLVGVIALGLPAHLSLNTGASLPLRETVVGIGCALILWGGALETAISMWQTVR